MSQPDITDRLDDLEAQLSDQQETIEQQQERIDQQAETIERQQERLEEQDAIIQSQRERLDGEATAASEADTTGQNPAEPETTDENTESPGPIATRRGVLTAGSVLGLLGLGAGTASADASGKIGISSSPLTQVYTEELNGGVTGDTQLTNIAGTNLSIDNSGNLNASGGTSAWVEGDNTNLLEPSSKNGIEVDTVADNGSGSMTMNSTLALGTNNITAGNTGLTVKTGGDRVLDLGTVTQTTINGTDMDGGGNVVAGHPLNSTSAVGAVISGGGTETTGGTDFSHTVSGDFGTIGGGVKNDVSKLGGSVGGGVQNTSSGQYTTVGGGNSNTSSDNYATVGGGDGNTASGKQATVSGGKSNDASLEGATVPGGKLNTADGKHSFAAGSRADTNGNDGAFVWGDSDSLSVRAGATDEVRFQATGGFVIAPRLDKTTMLDVQDKDGNSLLAADTTNHKVQVFDSTESESVEVSHDGTDGSLSTSAGGLTVKTDSNRVLKLGTVTQKQIEGLSTETGGNVVAGHPNNTVNNAAGAVIGGGGGDRSVSISNTVSGDFGTIAGGYNNEVSGLGAMVPGGKNNIADGAFSFAGGQGADTGGYDHVFVWGSGNTKATADYQARFQASGGFVVESGNIDAQGGTVENTNGALSLSTSSGDVDLQPSGTIDVNSNRISNAKEIHSDNNNITFKGSADVNLDGSILADKGGDLDIISTNSVNVDIDNDNNDTDGTRDFNVTKDGGATTLFTVNDGGEVDIFQGDLDMNSNGSVVNTSDVRAKTAIEPIAHPIEKLTELQPRTYEWKAEEAADGREAGVIAQSVEDVLPEAVQEDEDGFLKLAYRQLTPLVIGAVQEQQTEIEKLEADLDDKDERIEDLEAENEQLRERNAELEDRLATVEAELGIGVSAGQQGVADD